MKKTKYKILDPDNPNKKKTSGFFKRHVCAVCGNPTALNRFCYKCRKKIPSGFPMNLGNENIAAEIARNERAKAEFHKTTGIGSLSFDTERYLFHIDNGYYSVSDLVGVSFYMGEPRIQYGLFGNVRVSTDIYFSFTLFDQPRRVRKVMRGVACKYSRTDTQVSIEPPAVMFAANAALNQMINNMAEQLSREIMIRRAAGHFNDKT